MDKPSTQTPPADRLSTEKPGRPQPGKRTPGQRLSGPTALAALAGVAAAAVVLSVAELIGAFFTARATPVIALGSTFIDFTPPWMKDFAIATFGTNDKLALFVGMAVTILLLACVLGIVAYRKWALGVAGVLLMGAVIVASVVTRASVKPLDAVPTLIGTAAGLIALRYLITKLWRMQPWPEMDSDLAVEVLDRMSRTKAGKALATIEPDKAARLANYLITLRKELMWLTRATGAAHPALVDLDSFEMLDERFGAESPRSVFTYGNGWGQPGESVRSELLRVLDARDG